MTMTMSAPLCGWHFLALRVIKYCAYSDVIDVVRASVSSLAGGAQISRRSAMVFVPPRPPASDVVRLASNSLGSCYLRPPAQFPTRRDRARSRRKDMSIASSVSSSSACSVVPAPESHSWAPSHSLCAYQARLVT